MRFRISWTESYWRYIDIDVASLDAAKAMALDIASNASSLPESEENPLDEYDCPDGLTPEDLCDWGSEVEHHGDVSVTPKNRDGMFDGDDAIPMSDDEAAIHQGADEAEFGKNAQLDADALHRRPEEIG